MPDSTQSLVQGDFTGRLKEQVTALGMLAVSLDGMMVRREGTFSVLTQGLCYLIHGSSFDIKGHAP